MPRPDPKAHMKSWVIKWKGNTPVLEHSTWAPGYTPGHQETEKEAIAAEVVSLMDSIAAFREKWLNLNLLAEAHMSDLPEEANAFGQMLTVTEHDDPHEEMTMPEGAQDITDAMIQEQVDEEMDKIGDPEPWLATDAKIDRWEEEEFQNVHGYDDHQDH